jgi:small subunit ribosomal protein S7
MPRKYKSFENLLRADPRYNNKFVGKFINYLMYDGKKTLAQKIFYSALEELKKKITDKDPLDVFHKAIENIKPQLEVRSRRIGGATYQVPVNVPPKRQNSLAIRWIVQAVRKKKGKATYLKLAEELALAYKGEGEAITTRNNVYKMAEANRAFAHFARFR